MLRLLVVNLINRWIEWRERKKYDALHPEMW